MESIEFNLLREKKYTCLTAVNTMVLNTHVLASVAIAYAAPWKLLSDCRTFAVNVSRTLVFPVNLLFPTFSEHNVFEMGVSVDLYKKNGICYIYNSSF